MAEKTTIEDLAGMIARGFEETAKKADMDARFDKVEERLDHVELRLDRVEGRLDHMDARMGRVEADLAEIRGNLVYRHEFEDLMARVKYVETKLGIESGK
jgi:tetrahydromethanopterin S-methyltransferase subunit G